MKKTMDIICRMNRTVALRKAWTTIVTKSQVVVVMNAALLASVEKMFVSFLPLLYHMYLYLCYSWSMMNVELHLLVFLLQFKTPECQVLVTNTRRVNVASVISKFTILHTRE